jgi:hypothetical protein
MKVGDLVKFNIPSYASTIAGASLDGKLAIYLGEVLHPSGRVITFRVQVAGTRIPNICDGFLKQYLKMVKG